MAWKSEVGGPRAGSPQNTQKARAQQSYALRWNSAIVAWTSGPRGFPAVRRTRRSNARSRATRYVGEALSRRVLL
jgi:hypothetical protein